MICYVPLHLSVPRIRQCPTHRHLRVLLLVTERHLWSSRPQTSPFLSALCADCCRCTWAMTPPPPPGTCFNFHSGRGGGGLPPWTPSPPPPSAQVHPNTRVLGTFFSHGKKFVGAFGACHSLCTYCSMCAPYTLFHPYTISLGDGTDPANFLGFRGSVPLLPNLCPLSVP